MKKRTTENELLTAIRFTVYPGGAIECSIDQLVRHRGINICYCDDCEEARRSLPQTIFTDEEKEKWKE